ncbi:hypothetical protein FQA47_009722 [Oryzias melastigma]|uniref:Uncharacterized protein n=1 Tax=Oryzias melastigma TaxID=30732 RepID=A0A834C8J7_ORYME|nr:hypothetical protein FQA47_009722 [Oryzias melastigma]
MSPVLRCTICPPWYLIKQITDVVDQALQVFLWQTVVSVLVVRQCGCEVGGECSQVSPITSCSYPPSPITMKLHPSSLATGWQCVEEREPASPASPALLCTALKSGPAALDLLRCLNLTMADNGGAWLAEEKVVEEEEETKGATAWVSMQLTHRCVYECHL